MSYLQYALAKELTQSGFSDDWTRDGDHFWQPKSLAIEYRQAATFGDVLTAQVWLSQPDPVRPAFGFDIKRSKTASEEEPAESVVRARFVWQRVSRETGEPVCLPNELLAGLPADGGSLPRRFDLPPDSERPTSYYWDHTVMRAEVGPDGYVHLQAVYRWLEESVFDACAQSGWTPERRLATGHLVFQMRHDAEFQALPSAGDAVRVTSRLIDVRRFRGTWIQEAHTLPEGDLLVRDFSTGVFVDSSGRPATPPQDLMDEIQYGPKT